MNKPIHTFGYTYLLLFFLFTNDMMAQNINRGPYLQSVYKNHITIKWRTDVATNSKVWYGTAPDNLSMTKVAMVAVEDHEILLTGLIADTKYYYAIGNETGILAGGDAQHYFETSPLENSQEQVRMWVLGDPGFGNNNQREVRDGFYEYNQDLPLDLILTLGDNAYQDGTDGQYQDGWFENMYEDKLINTPLFMTYGNHDAESADGEDGTGPYFDILTLPTNGECGGQPSNNESYYSHDYGNIHFISLNTWDVEHTLESPMIQWLEDDLASNTQDWTIVTFHHPTYDGQRNNLSDDRSRNTRLRENMTPLFDQYGVDLVMMGHSHTYQRSYFIHGHYGTSNTFDPDIMGIDMGDGQLDGDGAYKKIDGKGIPYVVCGTSAYSQENEDLNHAVMYHNELTTGSVYLELNYDQLDYKYITSDGMVSDYFTIQKGLELTVYDCPDLNTNFGENCSDNIEYTYQDTFDTNCNCVGTPYDCPLFLADFGTPCDDNNPNTYIDILNENCDCAGTLLYNTGTVTVPIGQSSDDAEEYGDGIVKTESSDLEIVQDNTNQTIGLRFNNITIPEGATLIEAQLQFTVDQTNTRATSLDIYGEANNDPLTFSGVDFNISNRPTTNNSVLWLPPEWATVGNSGIAQQSADVISIIEELRATPGYNNNGSMVFLITGTGKRVAVSYDGIPSDAAELIIKYGFNCIDSDGDGVCDNQDDCPDTPGGIGTACNDGNPQTYDDVLNSDCNCVGTLYDCPALQTNIGESCDDGNPQTVTDIIQPDCECEGVAPTFDCPSLAANFGDSCNDNNTLTVNDQITTDCGCSGTEAANNTLTVAISSPSDDAEQRLNGSVGLFSSDLEMNIDNGASQITGLRFAEVDLPASAMVTNAYIQFTGDEENHTDPCILTIHGEASNNPTTFLAQSGNISDRPQTTASATWTPNTIWAEDMQTTAQRTSNLSSVIQEIIAQPNYAAGNAMAFLISGTGNRVAVSFDKNESQAATLTIEYSYTCIDSDNDGICDSSDNCPNTAGSIGSPCDDNNAATIDDVIDENCNCVGTEPVSFVCRQVDVYSDDAEEQPDGSVKLYSSDLELTKDINTQNIGLRFTDLNIPADISITNAQIQFEVDETKNEMAEYFIYGELSSNPQTFTDEDYDISDRTLTNNVVIWQPAEWTTNNERGPAQQTVDLSPVLQEIVNQQNYDPNNSIVFIIQGAGKRVAKSFDGDTEGAAELCVDYDLSSLNAANPYQENESSDLGVEIPNNVLTVFPNPVKNFLSINFDAHKLAEVASVQILDGTGKLIKTEAFSLAANQQRLSLNQLNLQKGFYTIQMKRGNEIETGKFVVVK